MSGCQAARLNPPEDRAISADQDVVVDDAELVVVTPSPTAARSLLTKAVPLGYQLIARENLEGLSLTMLTLKIPANQDGASAIRELEQLEPSVTAGVNHAYTPQRGSSSQSAREYAPQLMQWSQSGCLPQSSIGVLDSRLTGPARVKTITADFSRGQGSEEALHGTQVVSLFQLSGLLKTPRIYHADVVSAHATLGDTASVDSMVRGLNWLMTRNVKVINISLAGPYNKIIDRAFANAERKGAIMIAPAGNSGPGQNVLYPAALGSTIAVTAIDADKRVYRKAVRGQKIDFSAPGVDVSVRLPSQDVYVTGTSFAAPFVTMRIAADPRLVSMRSAASVKRALARSATDLGADGHDPVYGFGLISAPAACRA
ncbi:MAG: S8 family serine peptidase [Pseudomonadota bacterium]